MVDIAKQNTPEMLKKATPSALTPGGSKKGDIQDDVPGSFPQEQKGSLSANPGQDTGEEPIGHVDDTGNVVDDGGNVVGYVAGDAANLVNSAVDQAGNVLGQDGDVIGNAEQIGEVADQQSNGLEAVADTEGQESSKKSVQGAFNVNEEGEIVGDNEEVVGKLAEGQPQDLTDRSIKEIDREGNLKTAGGTIIGKGDIQSEVLKAGDQNGDQADDLVDTTVLKGKKVNKAGNVVGEDGTLLGQIETGDVKQLVGRTVDEEGNVWNESGKVIGTIKAIPEQERTSSAVAPFEDLPDATVDNNGKVIFEGQIVGRVIEGDPEKLAHKKVDQDGEIVDKLGNVLGKAERWKEEQPPEPEPEDLSALAGRRVNKLGNLVDANGAIYGRLAEGDPKKLAGKMCDKNGNIWNEGGDIVGKAELVPESEREGQKEGIFTGFDGLTVDKNGKVVDAKGAIVGRLVDGDAKKLYGKAVDEDGDILDKNGNALGKAERWEEEEKEKPHNPLAGRKVNREGNVVDDNGDLIGKLTEGTVSNCVGMEIDDDGDLVNSKGNRIGHATLLENIPQEEPAEPAESEEEAEKRKQAEQDKKLAGQMATCIQQSLDKIHPILRMITSVSAENMTFLLWKN